MKLTKEGQLTDGDMDSKLKQIKEFIDKVITELEDEVDCQKDNMKGVRRTLPICGKKINWEYQ